MKIYYAVCHKDDDSAFGFWFPDVKGCFGAGETMEEALEDASSALVAHIELLQELGKPIPDSRTLDQIHKDADVKESKSDSGYKSIVGVPVVIRKKLTKRVSFNADAGIVDAIENQVFALGLTKTQWWIQAAYNMLGAPIPENKSKKAKKPKKASGKHSTGTSQDSCFA